MDNISRPAWLASNTAVGIFAVVIAVALVGTAAVVTTSRGGDQQNTNQQQQQTQPTAPPIKLTDLPYSILYGTWSGDSSYIKSFDLKSGDKKLVATLPFTIKKITYIAPNKLLYIDQLDAKDYGNSVSMYNVASKTTQNVFTAEEDFGVNTYIISPNKRYMAVWEVAFGQNTNALTGGKSRVYAVDLSNPATKYRLYDESNLGPGSPAHYPVAVTDSGDVFTDKFVPNTLRGWAYGMSYSNFTGTTKSDIAEMASGTYASQPLMSPDGRQLAFVGYSGKDGDGNTVRSDGFRQAMFSADQIEFLDLATRARRKIDILPNTNAYTPPMWDSSSYKIYYSQISPKIEDLGFYEYNTTSNTAKKITLPTENTFASNITGNTLLIGAADNSTSVTGRLGAGYFAPFSSFSVIPESGGTPTNIPVKDSLMQYVTIVPSSDILALNLPTESLGGCGVEPNLKLCSFRVEPQLNEKRTEHENDPIPTPGNSDTNSCIFLAYQQCLAMGYTEEGSPQGGEYSDLRTCRNAVAQVLRAEGTQCSVSPLYLYSTEGKKVTVEVNTPVFNTKPTFTKKVTLTTGKNNSLIIGGKTFDSLAFDYEPAIRVQPPTYGTVVNKIDLKKTIIEYARSLGLTQREEDDLVTSILPEVDTDYAFLSYYEHDISKYILPLKFDPTPDSYINIVFYVQELQGRPSTTPPAPKFTKYQRTGFTAVEISTIFAN
jgi:hypothetical protein